MAKATLRLPRLMRPELDGSAILNALPHPVVVVDQLVKDHETNVVRRVKEKASGARESRLSFRRLKSDPSTTLLEIRPTTGRSHQIRVQLAGAGHPIVGDRKYGSKRPFKDGIALRAVRLTFEHPTTKLPITVESPADWPQA